MTADFEQIQMEWHGRTIFSKIKIEKLKKKYIKMLEKWYKYLIADDFDDCVITSSVDDVTATDAHSPSACYHTDFQFIISDWQGVPDRPITPSVAGMSVPR